MKEVIEHHEKNLITVFKAAQLKEWQFRIDDRVLCLTGSPENREKLADLIFKTKENGGEGWDTFGSHHNTEKDMFGTDAVGRPVFFYNDRTGICGRIYGYARFLASVPEAVRSGRGPDRQTMVFPAEEPVQMPKSARTGEEAVNQSYGKYLNMVCVKGGTFDMGSPDNEIYHGDDQPGERPQHRVTLDDYYIDAATITQREYVQVMGVNSAVFKGEDMPAVNVTWYDAVLFCNARSKRDGLEPVYSFTNITGSAGGGCKGIENLAADFTKNGYRLPTEAEWENACRAGTKTRFFWGEEIDGSYGWSEINTDPVLRPVMQKKPNAWGLYDMAGNVQEWCNDWFSGTYYAESPVNNPRGPDSGQLHVLRGGSNYRYKDRDRLRSANRSCNIPESCGDMCGFRTVARVS
jgi:formylglycine-generating enzyme required for sulfatase activity